MALSNLRAVRVAERCSDKSRSSEGKGPGVDFLRVRVAQAQLTLVFLCVRLFPPRPASLKAIFNPSLGLCTAVRALLEVTLGVGRPR